jgi:TetR/AcrR family transcriptional regulator
MDIQIEGLSPIEGMRKLVSATFHSFADHPEIISLLNTENLYKAIHVKQSERILNLYHPVINMIRGLLRQGAEEGIFRADVDAVEIYISIVALGYYYLSNKYTLSSIFNIDLDEPDRIRQRHDHIVDMVLSYLKADVS